MGRINGSPAIPYILEGQVDDAREMKMRHLNLLPLSKVDPAIEGN